jgi:ATP-dependent protease ClpP protease subunit
MFEELKTDFFIFREFDEVLLNETAPEIMRAAAMLPVHGSPRINLWINSPGGYTHVLKSILDAVELAQSRGVEVATYATGAVFSCGSLLAVSGTPGLRFMGKTAHHLLHFGWTGAEGTNPTELARDVARSNDHFEFIYNGYRKHAKVPRLRDKLHDDNLFVGYQQAIEWGLADKPISGK